MMFAKLVGEGFEKPEGDSDLPIDIHYSKIVEWVVDRKIVSQDWKQKLEALQKKVEQESKGLPVGLGVTCDEGSQMHYFQCVEILEKLKETAERTVLGSLKGDAGKWEKIVNAYQSSMLHVAEGGLILSRNVEYEIPYLQKQTMKHRQQMEDLEKKSIELRKSAETSHEQFLAECLQVGVPDGLVCDAESLDASLLLSAESLVEDIGAFTKYITSHAIEDTIAYYDAFIKEHFQQNAATTEVLPVLAQVLQGRTEDVGEEDRAAWVDFCCSSSFDDTRDDVPGAVIAEEEAAGQVEDHQEIEISWDGLEIHDDNGEDVATLTDVGEQHIDISWDIDVSGAGESDAVMAHGDDKKESEGIDISMAVTRLLSSLDAHDKETRRITVDASYRVKVLDDILELQAFVSQRVKELKSNTTVFSDTKEDITSVQGMQHTLSHAAEMLTSGDIMNKIALITSKSHRDRIGRKLVTMSGKQAKQMAESRDAERKRIEIQRILVSDSSKQSALVKETKHIKQAVEAALGARIQRKVNIQGSIHNIIKTG